MCVFLSVYFSSVVTCCLCKETTFLLVLKLDPARSRYLPLMMAGGHVWVRSRLPWPVFRMLRCWKGLATEYFSILPSTPLTNPNLKRIQSEAPILESLNIQGTVLGELLALRFYNHSIVFLLRYFELLRIDMLDQAGIY